MLDQDDRFRFGAADRISLSSPSSRGRPKGPGIFEPGASRWYSDQFDRARERRAAERLRPSPPPPPPATPPPLLVVGVLLAGEFDDVLPRCLAGVVPTLLGAAPSPIRYLRPGDVETSGRGCLRSLVAMGFTAFASAGAVRGLRSVDSLVEDDLVGTDGVNAADLPCIAYYVAGESKPAVALPLPPELWSTAEAQKRLRSILRSDLGGQRIIELAQEAPEGDDRTWRQRFARHVIYVHRRLLPMPVKVEQATEATPKTELGRPRRVAADPEDQQIRQAWETGAYRTYKEMARETNWPLAKIQGAMERTRKQRERARRRT